MADNFDLSIVVASWSSDESLSRCLESLAPQWADAEVIVATNRDGGELERRFPHAKFVRGPDGATVFRLRAIGAAVAHGNLIALLEDHVMAGPQWATAMRDAYHLGQRIIGGPIENGFRSRAIDWALYFVEYGYYMPPMQSGIAPRLSGLNIAYDRELLFSCQDIWANTFQEKSINDALGAMGHTLYLAPNALVDSYLPMTLAYGMAHLRDGGHQFALYRASNCSRVKRFIWVLASPLVPGVLFLRLAQAVVFRRPERMIQLLWASPMLVLVLGAWAWGESTGYLAAMRND